MTESRSVVAWVRRCKGGWLQRGRRQVWGVMKMFRILIDSYVGQCYIYQNTSNWTLKIGAFYRMQMIPQLSWFFLKWQCNFTLHCHIASSEPSSPLLPPPSCLQSGTLSFSRLSAPWLHPPSLPRLPFPVWMHNQKLQDHHHPLNPYSLCFDPWIRYSLPAYKYPAPRCVLFTFSTLHPWAAKRFVREG